MQHIVFRLADSLPSAALQKMERLGQIERFLSCERLLDKGGGAAILKSPEAAQIVVDLLLWFDGQRYSLIAWCVMPNHVHVVIQPTGGYLLGRIVKSWKAFSAARINQEFGKNGRLWAPDYFDRFMRSDAHLSTTIAYVENNPVAAGLCARPVDWPYSSATARLA